MVLRAILERLVEAIAVVVGAFLDGYPEPRHRSEEAALTDYFVRDSPPEMGLKVSFEDIEIIPWPFVPLVCAAKGI